MLNYFKTMFPKFIKNRKITFSMCIRKSINSYGFAMSLTLSLIYCISGGSVFMTEPPFNI